MSGLMHRRVPKRVWSAVRCHAPQRLSRLLTAGDAPPAAVSAAGDRPLPYRPWRVVWCIAALGHFWWPGSDQCLDCGAWRRDR